MQFAKLVSKGWDALIYALLILLLVIPPLYLQVTVQDTYRVPQEFLIVAGGWVLIFLIQVKRGVAGRPLWGGGQGSWARWGLGLLLVWLIANSAIGYAAAAPWRFAMTAVTYLLLGQSIVDWLGEKIERRRAVLVGLAALVAEQALFALGELARLPLREWADQTPLYTTDKGMIPFGWWPHDILYVLSFPAAGGIPVGTLGNVNYVAELIVLCLPVLVVAILSLKHKVARAIGVISILPVFYVLVATGTRAALLGMLIGGAVSVSLIWSWRRLDIRQYWQSAKGKAALGAGGVLAIVFLALAGRTLIEKLSRVTGHDSSVDSRLTIWKSALGMWSQHPVTGQGPGSFRVLNPLQLLKLYPQGLPDFLVHVRFGEVHNELIQALVELGLIGAVLVLFTLVAWCWDIRRNQTLEPSLKVGLTWGLIAVSVASLFGFPFHIPTTAFAIMLVLALGISRTENPTATVPGAARMAYGLAIAGLLAVAGTAVVEKDVAPYFDANRYGFVAKQLQDADRMRESQVVYELSMRDNRYKGNDAYFVLLTLNAQNKYDEILGRYDSYVKAGLGLEGLYWKARALYGTGHTVEAVNAYNQIIRTMGMKDENGQRAHRRLEEIAKELVQKKDKSGLRVVVKSVAPSKVAQ